MQIASFEMLAMLVRNGYRMQVAMSFQPDGISHLLLLGGRSIVVVAGKCFFGHDQRIIGCSPRECMAGHRQQSADLRAHTRGSVSGICFGKQAILNLLKYKRPLIGTFFRVRTQPTAIQISLEVLVFFSSLHPYGCIPYSRAPITGCSYRNN